ncbi:hypothetical protein Fcan01_15646 [Folsomia candida]|uniref:Uncharacterized protein n=1 Tax=Folsomia candida TaxID=158441 RepID=A0A226DX28_FOLCA|nr:hypothetical protein Fcan01_15646 [Folsomia candida]
MSTTLRLYRVANAYSNLYKSFPQGPVSWNAKRAGFVAGKWRNVLPWLFFSSGLVMFGLGLIPKLIQAMYLYFLYRKEGYIFPAGNEFSTPLQLVTIVIFCFICGVIPVINLGIFVGACMIERIFDAIIPLEEALAARSGSTTWKNFDRDTLIEIGIRAACQVPKLIILMAPLLSAFAIYQRIDPIYIFVKIVLRYEPYGKKVTFWTKLTFRLVSFVTLMITEIEDGRIMQMIAIIFVLAAYLFTKNVELLHDHWKVQGSALGSNLHVEKSILQHNQIIIVCQEVAPIQSQSSLYMLKASASAIVLCNYLTLKMWNKVPLTVRFRSTTLLVIILNLSLRYAFQITEMTESLAKIWADEGAHGGNKKCREGSRGSCRCACLPVCGNIICSSRIRITCHSLIWTYWTARLRC